MTTFHLKIVTPDRLVYDGQAERLVIRTVGGDVCILARHIDYAAPLDIGQAHIVDEEGKTRQAACSGGMLTVYGGEAVVMATTFEWADEIDRERAQQAQQAAEEKLKNLKRDDREFMVASAKLKRAIARIGASE
ncbi:MAG: ATP synthase F1 subunit epsilon [Clostridiales bacterium]|nr:ATP synthase F1 subunit epsilon [Clostridiales bacterium]